MTKRLILALLLCMPSVGLAATAEPLAGWTNADGAAGVTLSGNPVRHSSPVIAEIDGDSSNGMKLAVASSDGTLYVYRANGTLLWSANLPNKSCKLAISTNKALSSPAVGAIYGDGVPYVVVGFGGITAKRCDGGVAAYRGSDGHRRWVFSLKNYSKKQRFYAYSYSVFSTPALADTDGDGKMEIGFGGFDRNVYLLNYNGKVRWYYHAADTVWSSPSFLQVSGERTMRMVIGTDISANKFLNPPTTNGGNLYAFDTAKRRKPKINFRQQGGYYWQTPVDQVVFSSPVIGDVLASNPGPEIVVGSGCFFPQKSKQKKGNWIKILRISDGTVLQTLPTAACSSSQAAIADLDGDGQNEIIATVNGNRSVGGDGYGRIYAFKADNTTPMWSVVPLVRGANDQSIGDFKSPVVADLDGNGSLEVIASNGSQVSILNGTDGRSLTCDDADCTNGGPILSARTKLYNTPAVADINNDGKLDLFVAGAQNGRGPGVIYAWTNFAGTLNSDAGLGTPYAVPWGMVRGNAGRRGLLP